MSLNITHSRLSRLAVAVLSLGVAACANPVQEDHEEHAVGFVVLNAQNQEVARFSGSAVTGQLTVTRSAPSTFTVAAIAEDGDRITIDGEEFELRVSVTGAGASAVVQNQNQVLVTGTQVGTTELRIILMHEGHEEFNQPFVVLVS